MPKAKRLTVAGVEKINPPKSGRVEHFDTEVPSFALRVSETGIKSWVLFYRIDGKQRRLTIGKYPALGLKEARSLAREAYTLAQRGEDPASLRWKAKEAARQERHDSYESTVRDYVRLQSRRKKKNRTSDRIEAILLDYAKDWHRRPMKSIGRRDVAELLDEVSVENGPYMANHVYANLSAMFNWALSRDIITALPIHKSLKPHKSVPRKRVLDNDEIVAVWNAAIEVGYPYGHIVRFALMSLQRLREVSELPGTELDFEARAWSLPEERTKGKRSHVVPLTDSMIELLEELPRLPGRYLFSTSSGELPFQGFSKSKKRLDKIAKVEDFRIHDLRRTGASVMKKHLGVPEEVIGWCLNHAPVTVTGKSYATEGDPVAVRTAFERWNGYLKRLIEGKEQDNIVPLTG